MLRNLAWRVEYRELRYAESTLTNAVKRTEEAKSGSIATRIN